MRRIQFVHKYIRESITAASHPSISRRSGLTRTIRWLMTSLAYALLAAAPARSTLLFRPIGRPPEVFAYNGLPMSQPLSNTNALNSPKVYFIFVGPNWEQNGIPINAVTSMVNAAKSILSSSYLSGLTQYGSDGKAIFANFTIDTSLNPLTWSKDYTLSNGTIDHSANPVWYETDQILSNPTFSSWNPPGGDARNSPVYVVARYTHDGLGVTGEFKGSNNFGPNDYTSRAVNVIDVAITSADQVDEFSWVFSHEIAERVSTGTGGLSEVSPDSGGQIADGEPEGNNYYAWRLNGTFGGPVVTAYWSVIDQAFIIPDGNLDRTLLVPVWDRANWTGSFVSLQSGNLYLMSPPGQTTLIDTQVQSYVVKLVNGAAHIFDLTANGQVKQYSGSGGNWTALTDAPTVASRLATTSYLSGFGNNYAIEDGDLYMLASNGGHSQIWKYSGSGTNWAQLTGSNTWISDIAVAGGSLYMLASNDPNLHVWQYSGWGTNWTQVTGSNTWVSAIAAVAGSLYMLASNDGHFHVWQYSGGSNWAQVTGSNTSVYSLAAAGDVLCMLASNSLSDVGVWQFGLTPNVWQRLTGANTTPRQIVVQDGIGLYMQATNGGNIYQVWQYVNPSDWLALTGTNTNVQSISIGADSRLYMTSVTNGGPVQSWVYDGFPDVWTLL
jgi:hypothetical protein